MARSLRLATYNLESLGERPARPPLAARLEPLRAVLAALDADVLCLQEIDGQHPTPHEPRRLLALEALVAGTPYAAYAMVASHRQDGGVADVHNLAILSRLPVRSSGQVWNDTVAAPAFDRPVLHAVVEAHGVALHVVNLHLRAPLGAAIPGGKAHGVWQSAAAWAEGFFLAGVKRSAQALEARHLVDAWLDADEDAAIVVAGDFNCDEREVPFRILRAGADDTGNAGLAGRELVAVEETIPAAARFSVVHAGSPRLVDHLLLSRVLAARLRGAWIRNDALPDEVRAAAGSLRASTHAPVVAEIEL